VQGNKNAGKKHGTRVEEARKKTGQSMEKEWKKTGKRGNAFF